MKKFILGILCTICVFTLCSFTYYNLSNSNPNFVEVSECKLNGHYYVVAKSYDPRGGVSIIHSPNCKCNKR